MQHYEPVIGLEVHCQLLTVSKLYCACSTAFGAAPNSHTCPVCLGYPGTLPVLNQKAVVLAYRMGLALAAEIHPFSVFSRKQYFYPDLPKGYQISQHDRPYCTKGRLELDSGKTVSITRIHMEEDAGKLIHTDAGSFIDLNRAGTPLIEIVSDPVLSSPEEAGEYLRRLHAIVRFIGVCDGNMEEGSFRCDANVSLRPVGAATLGTRCEIKNLNSFRNVERALAYEILRQTDMLAAGEVVRQETRSFDAATGKTAMLRSKEDAHDYRYLPEPDLPVLVVSAAELAIIAQTQPELPLAKGARYQQALNLSPYDSDQLLAEPALAAFFEAAWALASPPLTVKLLVNWILGELMSELNSRSWTWTTLPLRPEALVELLTMVARAEISGKIAKQVLVEMLASGATAASVVATKGLAQVSDLEAIRAAVRSVLAAHPGPVQEYRAGKTKVLGFLVGQLMRSAQGRFNPSLLNQILLEELGADQP